MCVYFQKTTLFLGGKLLENEFEYIYTYIFIMITLSKHISGICKFVIFLYIFTTFKAPLSY
jgi:hypothetical protein